MPRITISYRRDDSDVITGRIFDRLSAHYGRETVFRDIDSIPLGVDFRKHVNTVIDDTDIMVAVVGPKWIGPRAGQSRLDNAADPVRVEIDAALRKGVPLIPVLVLRAQMPRADQLPPALEDFAYRNAARIDAGQDFDTHMGRLIRAIDNVLEEKAQSPATAAGPANISSPPELTAPPTALSAEEEERQRFAEQLRREEEERQRQVEEDRQREIAEARRREEEERQQLLAEQARLQQERQRFEAAVRQAAEQRERDEKERLEAAARQAAEQEERQRLEAAARQAAEQEERQRLEAAARQAAEQEERRRLEVAARPSAEQPEREKMEGRELQRPQAAPAPVAAAATIPAQSDFKRKAAIVAGLAGLAIAVVVVILVSRPGPTPPPAPTPAPIPAPTPTPSPTPQSASITLVPGQQWSVSFTDNDNSPYQGTLTVAQAAGYNSFTGHFDVSFKGNDSNNITTVREDALITINDTKITISCSNVTYLTGSGNYTPDYFDLTIKSPTEAEGDSLDSKDAHGHATMWRM